MADEPTYRERESDLDGRQPPGFISGEEAMQHLSDGRRVVLELSGGEDVEPVVVQKVPRCDTCRWWRLHESAGNPHKGICALGSWLDFKGLHKPPTRPPAHKQSKAHATGSLMTSPDFGCVQWEPIE